MMTKIVIIFHIYHLFTFRFHFFLSTQGYLFSLNFRFEKKKQQKKKNNNNNNKYLPKYNRDKIMFYCLQNLLFCFIQLRHILSLVVQSE